VPKLFEHHHHYHQNGVGAAVGGAVVVVVGGWRRWGWRHTARLTAEAGVIV